MQPSVKKFALIVAGGKGVRMNQPLPKQFSLVAGKPILVHTLQAFAFDPTIQIILVLPPAHIEYWQQLCKQYQLHINHRVVAGGETRFQSVQNGLQAIDEKEGLVCIHDGVRPMVTQQIITNSFEVAALKGCAIAAVKPKDSIRALLDNGKTGNVNRDNFYLVQTPQTFDLIKIRHAYLNAKQDTFTDDASVFEHAGHTVHIIEGSYRNIKITTPEDLLFAEALFKQS